MQEQQVDQLVGHLFRQEAGKMVAVLTRLLGFGNLDAAEDIVQETLLKAVTIWKFKGIPENPSAWLYTVAKRKAVDVLRQNKLRENIQHALAQSLRSEWTLSPAVNHFFLENEIEDSQLRMIFACCHPAVPYDAQIALTLKTLCGLSISEIARSFLTSEETIAKRLFRAREKLRSEKIGLDVPAGNELHLRIGAVLHSLYLLFNEGYNSSHPEKLIRQDLCEEAIRLCLLLTRNPLTNNGQSNALLALMCFQASREDARLTCDGDIVLLKDQDRSRWDVHLIKKGIEYLEIAFEADVVTEYHLEAAIAACHATADTFEKTDWQKIHNLYEALSELKPGSIVQMNKAIALGYCGFPERALAALKDITDMNDNHLYHAAMGDFFFTTGNASLANEAYEKAITLAVSNSEKDLLRKKKEKLLQ
jgi:RNA polymerase sigma factor (sigma-70 family)